MTSEQDKSTKEPEAEEPTEAEEFWDEYMFGYMNTFEEAVNLMHQWFDESDFQETKTDMEISLDHASPEEWKAFLAKLEEDQ